MAESEEVRQLRAKREVLEREIGKAWQAAKDVEGRLSIGSKEGSTAEQRHLERLRKDAKRLDDEIQRAREA